MTNLFPPSVNYWPQSACAEAFWSQLQLPPYRRLLSETVKWLDPRPGDRWLDLGCGSGELSRALWRKSEGQVSQVIGLDCAAASAEPFGDGARTLQPPPTAENMQFHRADFTTGLASFASASFDGVVSGLAIQYAEEFCAASGRWTTAAYDRVLGEVHRILRPGGAFVFSVNVPEPSWTRVTFSSMKAVLKARRPVRYLTNAVRMLSYGRWLKREARRGRFHYLPLPTVREKLTTAGFANIEDRLSYARQAYLLRCHKLYA